MRFLTARKTMYLLSFALFMGTLHWLNKNYNKLEDSLMETINAYRNSTTLSNGTRHIIVSNKQLSSPSMTVTSKQLPSDKGIFPITGTKHLMISAYVDHRFENTIRVMTIVRHRDIGKLFCHICNPSMDKCNVSVARVEVNPHHWRFTYAAADVLCDFSKLPRFPRIRIANDNIINKTSLYLPIGNLYSKPQPLRYNFTVCLSLVHSNYNNALQFIQAMEMYKILGIDRAAIYNISSGPDIDRVLRHYIKEGTLEVIPWNIHDFMTTSSGWDPKIHGGEVHYHGQIVAVNECLNRYMFQSKYMLFHDIDEIVMPYAYDNLHDMMNDLDKKYTHQGIVYYTVPTFLFSKKVFDNTTKFHLKRWEKVPGVNIMEHVSNRRQSRSVPKLIVDPRRVLQISIHRTVKLHSAGMRKAGGFSLKPHQARLWHTRDPVDERFYYEKEKTKSEIDTRLANFDSNLVPNIDKALKSMGYL